jgi:hypothetical protein
MTSIDSYELSFNYFTFWEMSYNLISKSVTSFGMICYPFSIFPPKDLTIYIPFFFNSYNEEGTMDLKVDSVINIASNKLLIC